MATPNLQTQGTLAALRNRLAKSHEAAFDRLENADFSVATHQPELADAGALSFANSIAHKGIILSESSQESVKDLGNILNRLFHREQPAEENQTRFEVAHAKAATVPSHAPMSLDLDAALGVTA